MKYWIVIASVESWEETLELKMCGFPGSNFNMRKWKMIQEGDIALFYATQPVSGIIGCGIVKRKSIGTIPIWSREKRANMLLYPLRIEVDIDTVLPKDNWTLNRVKLQQYTNVTGSIRPLADVFAEGYISKLKERPLNL